MRWWLNLSTAVLALTALPCPALARLPQRALGQAAPACRFNVDLRTLREDLASAKMILKGRLTNATPPNPSGDREGVTDFLVDQSLKLLPGFRPEKRITIPRYFPDANKGKLEIILFVDVVKGKLDPWKGIALKANSDLPKYVAGILKIKDKKPSQRLRFYFDYLQNEDPEIANDALKEFDKAGYKDFAVMATDLPGDKVATWLKDPKTPASRIARYAFMLGHCSKNKEADVKLLRSLVEGKERRVWGGLDGVLAGYILLKPKEGLSYVRDILRNPKKEFLLRYAALRAARFFIDSRPDVLPRQDVLQAVALLLPQEDIADFAIEDFRKWKAWDLTPHVLALGNSKKHDIAIIRRAILRFTLCSPLPEAKQFVAQKRRSDPTDVSDQEELLKLEQAPQPAKPPK